MKKIITLLMICLPASLYSQQFLNLDFEYSNQGTQTPQKWFAEGEGYRIKLDDSEKASLLRSLKIESINPDANSFGVCTSSFPVELVKGKEIEFSGKIKTKDITEGFAGLWWRVDGKDGMLGFDNMSDRGLSGTNDWTKVSIKMKVDEGAVNINFGGLFPGKGTAWFDSFEILIDGQKFVDVLPSN